MHWRRKWQPTPVFLPGDSQGRGSLVGCCLWEAQIWTQLKRLSSSSSSRLPLGFPGGSVVQKLPANARDMGSIPGLERSPRGGNGNPLQCSCLENPRDGEAWWAAVYGVTQSWTQLKRLSSSSSQCSGLENSRDSIVHGIFQARTLEWVAISFSNA